jgi:hypothetical protein
VINVSFLILLRILTEQEAGRVVLNAVVKRKILNNLLGIKLPVVTSRFTQLSSLCLQ